jgi:pimeloyl-ACP methyl ester carboxylesterase
VIELDANGLKFTCRQAGPDDGEPVVLLHGFPETSHMWERLMADLAGAGFRSLAPDQRGYSPGARPPDVSGYAYDHLVADVLALAPERFHLIGHDWGAIVGWALLDAAPERVKTWTALSVGHYRAFAEAVYSDPEQAPYRAFLDLFTSPQAEEVLLANDMAGLKAAWADEHAAAYTATFEQPGALTAALNWYRACDAHKAALADAGRFGPVATPTRLLWGRHDPYCRRAGIEAATDYMTGPYQLVELDAGHFLLDDAYDEVRDNVLSHLRSAT